MNIKIFFVIFSFVGSCLLTGGLVSFSNTRSFIKNADSAKGIVIKNISRTSRDNDGRTTRLYYPVTKFTSLNGAEITFENKAGASPASYSSGDEVTVLYTKQNPRDAKINSFMSLWATTSVLFFIGGTFFLCGVVPLVMISKKEKARAWAKARGKMIQVEVTSVEINRSYKVNDKSPWVVAAKWENPYSNETVIFKSEHLWSDPTPHIKKGTLVTVKYDTRNPKRHWMDTEPFASKAA